MTEPTRLHGGTILLVIVLSLVMGVVGALGALSAVVSDPSLQATLGLGGGESGQSVGKQEKLVLEESSAVIDVSKEVNPAVVSILSTRNVRDFFGNVVQQQGGGTGFIVTSEGLILTNKHVVDAQADYTVITSDGKDFPGKILATDPVFDLAILKIEASGLPVVKLGDSDDLQVGQFVVAIGNALAEFQNTVTVGVVSAKDRQIVAGGPDDAERLEGLIQTDAAINPGNSGGPLVNLKGQVVGINTAIAGDAQGIGFAIPINIAKTSLSSFQKNAKIARPALGVRYLPITKEIARLENLPVDHGALIVAGSQGESALVPDGPAAKAGLKENDIITSINGEEITEARSLARLLQQYQVGDTVKLKVLRSGQTLDLSVTLGELS